MYDVIDTSRDDLVNVMEVMYGVDTVHFNDQKFFHFDDHQEKEFINAKSFRSLRDKKNIYSVESSNPLQIFMLGM